MSNLRPERHVAFSGEKITQEVYELHDLGFSGTHVFNVVVAAAARCFFSKVLHAIEWAPPWTAGTAMKPMSRFSVTICHSSD